MSTLIPSMPYPDRCTLCRFHELEWEWNNEHHSRCQVEKKRIPAPSKNDYPIGKPKWCPLVEVPAPHGRLIDADALSAKCGDWYTEEGSEVGFIGSLSGLLGEQPTVIEAEGE